MARVKDDEVVRGIQRCQHGPKRSHRVVLAWCAEDQPFSVFARPGWGLARDKITLCLPRMTSPSPPTPSAEAAKLMDELCDVYADAYGAVPGEDTREKSSAFRARLSTPLRADTFRTAV